MTGEKDPLSVVAMPRPPRWAGDAGNQALQEATIRLADIRRASPRFKTKELVGLLLSHGARAWRNSLPPVDVRLRVFAPSGKPAVTLRF